MAGKECIYCGKDHLWKSQEHILQSSLGGRVVRKDLACADCNNSFSRKDNGNIDGAIADAFVVIRCGLAIWGDRKTKPPTLRNAGTLSDGTPYDLAPGFVPIIRLVQRKNTTTSDGLPAVQVITPDVESAKRQVEHLKEQYGEDAVRTASVVSVTEHVGPVKLRLSVGGRETLRAVTKNLMNLAGHMLPRDVVLGTAFDATKRVVRYNEGDVPAGHDYVNPCPPVAQLGEFDHVLHVVCDPARRHVRGYAQFFGGVKFSAILATGVDLPAMTASLVHDPLSAKAATHQASAIPAAYDDTAPLQPGGNFPANAQALTASLGRVFKTTQEYGAKHVDEKHRNDLLTAIGVCRNESEREAALEKWASRVATLMSGARWEENLSPAELE